MQSCRVFIENLKTKNIHQVTAFTSVNIKRSINNIASASVSLDNTNNQWYEYTKQDSSVIDNIDTKDKYKKTWLEGLANLHEIGDFTKDSRCFKDVFLFARIWIDVKGKEEGAIWQAAFTGVVTEVSDTEDYGQTIKINLACKELAIYMQQSLYPITPAIYGEFDFYISDFLTQAVLGDYFYVNSLASVPLEEVFKRLLQFANMTSTYKAFINVFDTVEDKSYKRPDIPDETVKTAISNSFAINGLKDYKDSANWYRQEQLWNNDVKHVQSGEFTSSRGVDDNTLVQLSDDIAEEIIIKDTPLWKMFYTPADIYCDSLIELNTTTFQRAFNSISTIFEAKKNTVWGILKDICNLLYLDIFTTGKGDIVIQIPRYDNLPSLENSTNEVLDMGWNRENAGAQFSHGKNYIIYKTDVISRSVEESFENTYTNISIAYAPVYADMQFTDDTARNIYAVGRAIDKNCSPLNFGFKTLIVDKLAPINLISELFTGKQVPNEMLPKDILAKYLLQTLNIQNFRTGSLDLDWRVDLELGKTVYIVNRNSLGYINSTSISYTPGQTLSTSYGIIGIHEINQIMPNFWAYMSQYFDLLVGDKVEQPIIQTLIAIKTPAVTKPVTTKLVNTKPIEVEKQFFFGMPLDTYGRISTEYGALHNINGKMKPHLGIDFTTKHTEMPVRACANGKVTFSGKKSGFGNVVEIKHKDGWMTKYAHLSVLFVNVGEIVHKGNQIGISGGIEGNITAGNSTGLHLHFELLCNGVPQNPRKYLPFPKGK